jgi:uncharacterized Fe-S cluster-containing radical SAM superfamily protein
MRQSALRGYSMVFQLLHVSGATRAMSAEQIREILEVSRRNNAKLGVTGMLLHADGHLHPAP